MKTAFKFSDFIIGITALITYRQNGKINLKQVNDLIITVSVIFYTIQYTKQCQSCVLIRRTFQMTNQNLHIYKDACPCMSVRVYCVLIICCILITLHPEITQVIFKAAERRESPGVIPSITMSQKHSPDHLTFTQLQSQTCCCVLCVFALQGCAACDHMVQHLVSSSVGWSIRWSCPWVITCLSGRWYQCSRSTRAYTWVIVPSQCLALSVMVTHSIVRLLLLDWSQLHFCVHVCVYFPAESELFKSYSWVWLWNSDSESVSKHIRHGFTPWNKNGHAVNPVLWTICISRGGVRYMNTHSLNLHITTIVWIYKNEKKYFTFNNNCLCF